MSPVSGSSNECSAIVTFIVISQITRFVPFESCNIYFVKWSADDEFRILTV